MNLYPDNYEDRLGESQKVPRESFSPVEKP
jgi:hypothetical protein